MDPDRQEIVASSRPSLRKELPSRLPKLIGREDEAAEIAALLETERLVTLVGAGGCGKTRLALKVTANHATAVHWVDLSTLADEDLEGPALGAPGARAAREPGQRSGGPGG